MKYWVYKTSPNTFADWLTKMKYIARDEEYPYGNSEYGNTPLKAIRNLIRKRDAEKEYPKLYSIEEI